MHEDTSCRWLTSANRSDRNELRSPDTVRYKRAVHNLLLVPRVINDITDEERAKVVWKISLSLYCLEFLFDFVRVCSDGVSLGEEGVG